MGCSQSKIENEEAVARCKERKHFMKLAVSSRNAFASAHSSHTIALKNTGAALSDFSSGEVLSTTTVTITTTTNTTVVDSPLPLHSQPPPPPIQTLPPPPPPIPDLGPTPLQRAVSMPEFMGSKPDKPDPEPTIEEEEEEEQEDEDEEEEHDERFRRRRRGDHHKGASVGGRMEGGGSEMGPPPVPPPPLVVEDHRPPPPPPGAGNSSYDYFFDVDNIPGGSLGDAEEMRREREREEHERRRRRMIDDDNNKRNIEQSVISEREEKPEKKMVEKPPLPQGKSLKKGKQAARPGMGMGSGPSGSGVGGGGGDVKRRYVSLVQIVTDLDNYFLAASESAQEVSKLLEAARLHYHSNFADNRGHIDHSARVMRVITWNRSFRGLNNAEDFKDDFDAEGNETHATVLDKLLAWEKKLYDEVKAGEIMKFEYQRKVSLLNKQKKRGVNSESLEKTKASVSRLHTRYIVDMQSMDSTVSEINRLRDEQLYPKLVALVDAMATMWDVMQEYHEKQLNIASALRYVDISQSSKETTDHHHERTIQLWGVVQEWSGQFSKMVNNQKEYIRSLNSWLKLNLIPIESNLKEKVSSPPRAQHPPILDLLLNWHDLLEKLPDEHATTAIHNFGAALQIIVDQQEDELRLRRTVEESIRDLEKKQRQYNKWLREYTQKRLPSDENEPHLGEDEFSKDEIIVEKEFVVENAKKKLDDDREAHQRQCLHVREKSLTSLKTRLPELFRALSDFAISSSDMYRNLKGISDSQSHPRRRETA